MTRRAYSLQVKVAVALVLLVLTPLGVAVWLSGQITEIATNFHAAEAETSMGALEKSIGTYHQLFEATKRLEAEIIDRVAKKRDIQSLDPGMDLAKILADERRLEPELRAIEVVAPDGRVIAQASRPASGPAVRDKTVEQPINDLGATVKLTFEVSATLQDEMEQVGKALTASKIIAEKRGEEVASWSRFAFLALMAGVVVIAGLLGWLGSTYVTRRIDQLVKTARKVSQGKLDARVQLRGHDEMAELGSAFNTMLDDLAIARDNLQHMQRMTVWQDVARRLAHEIKNPLTPIQLAVQQCVSSYKGDDARFKKLLADTGEIVEEEIGGLRRLVDTFRTLGALPKVEKAPILLAELIEELRLDPQMAQTVELDAPATPVTVRADKLLLKRVLTNLVENGLQAGGKVVVRWRADGSDAVIAVDDDGPGVPEADRERIFEPYVTTKSTGTGLGLAIARKICIEHGGDLSLAPERAPSGGARFVVSLPLRGPEMSLA